MTEPTSLLARLEATLTRSEILELLAAMEGRRLSLPTLWSYLRSEREAAVLVGWRGGQSYAELAARHGLSTRQVRRIVHPTQRRAA